MRTWILATLTISSAQLKACVLRERTCDYSCHDLHDDQLKGICKMIDGVNLMALTHTGSGKTGYFTMYMLLLLALSKDLNIVAPAKNYVPNNPVMVLVYPTI